MNLDGQTTVAHERVEQLLPDGRRSTRYGPKANPPVMPFSPLEDRKLRTASMKNDILRATVIDFPKKDMACDTDKGWCLMQEVHEIVLESDFLSGIELRQILEQDYRLAGDDVRFSVRKRGPRLRSPDSAILVAIIGSLGTTLVALISSLLQIAKEHKAAKIVLQSKDGRRIEFPADTPPEKIAELAAIAKEMDGPAIRIQS